ncbi:hypothetical protein M2335_000159 [Sphingobium sp. B12D2B]|nr:hypothetical protein [Sphingobium sp. B12D2B]
MASQLGGVATRLLHRVRHHIVLGARLGHVIGLAIGSLDEPERYPPTEHIWTSSALSWLTSADDLPHYPEGPPA